MQIAQSPVLSQWKFVENQPELFSPSMAYDLVIAMITFLREIMVKNSC